MADTVTLPASPAIGPGIPAPAGEGSPESAARIQKNFDEFEHYVSRAEGYLKQGELEAAAAHCAIASHLATRTHAGIFWSPRAEAILSEIGRRIPDPDAPAVRPRAREFKRILQVCTQVHQVGGHSKMLCQWVNADTTRTHSLVLTQHRGPTPKFVHDTFRRSGGKVEWLNHRPGGQIAWAKRLREIAKDFDLVILHTHCEDVVPVIAFAETEKYPPVLVLNHADHIFWYGPSICHLSINLRDAAQDLAIGRRGVAESRNILMPTLSESVKRTRSREEAKKEIGISPETILLVSAARKAKYRTMHGVTFADIHAPVLAKHPNATLLVCGAGDYPDWAPAKEACGGRIISLAETGNPKVYFEAADIYVDSYPFVSSTSMMEAAGYGLPMLTLFTAPDAARIFGINHVALVGTSQQARSFDEYRELLDRMISDKAWRQKLGQEGKEAVAREHNMPGWMRWLDAVYARAAELPMLDNREMLAAPDRPYFGEPDCRHEDIFGGKWPSLYFLKSFVGMLPAHQHLAHWNEVRRAGGFRGPINATAHLVPEWMKRVVKDRILHWQE
jgi:hypothetical protein